jgi:hypothetical protein
MRQPHQVLPQPSLDAAAKRFALSGGLNERVGSLMVFHVTIQKNDF